MTRENAPAAERDALLGTLLAGRYRIEQLIGTGGMGAVYRAEHIHMRKAMAVKVLHREMMAFPEVVARFEREAVAAGRIDHPHVVGASDFGRLDDGTSYLALEFVEGKSLAKIVDEEGALAPERALRITRQLAEALHAAHSAGIVHRDLKPENVMLVVKDTDPDFVKVLDFGIAKVKAEGNTEQQALTQLGTVFGTPEYMSPEQARGEVVDARADLYTVGVILYEMLSGVSPFKDQDLVVVLTRHLTAEPPPLSAELDPAVVDLTMWLLKKSPAERVQTAAELVAHIDVLLGPPGSAALAGTPAPVPASRVVRSEAQKSSENLDITAVAADTGYAPTLMKAAAPAGLRGSSVGEGLPAGARAWLQHEIQLGSRRLPLWRLAAGAVVAIVGVATLILLGSLAFGNKSGAAPVSSTLGHAPEDNSNALITRADGGDPTALAELSARPDKKRTDREWRALGHGYAKLAQFPASLAAYQKGVDAHPALENDPVVLSDVRAAALDVPTSEDALKLAATSMGPPGLDLIYDVWEDTRSKASQAALAKRARGYLDDAAARTKASPALKVLLDLTKAQKEGCLSVKRWLGRASAEGDARVVPLLKRFEDRRGCGFLGLGDCYSCLRAGKDIVNTSEAVSARPAPVLAP